MNNLRNLSFIRFFDFDLKGKDILLCLPEVGLAGIIASSQIIEQLNLREAAAFDSDLIPSFLVVREGMPDYPIRLYLNQKLAVLISEIPFAPKFANEFAKEFVGWAKEEQVGSVIGLTGIPSRRRITDQDEEINVFALASQKDLLDLILRTGVKAFEGGILVGSYASVMKHAMNKKLRAAILLAESYLDFPDPGAAALLLTVVNKLLSLDIETRKLVEESEEIRLRHRELMKRTQQAMQQTAQSVPSVYR